MNKKIIRDYIYLFTAFIFAFLYFPHIIACIFSKKKREILSDANIMASRINIDISNYVAVLYFLHNNPYFRTLFYHRIGPVISLLISWWRPGDRYFTISATTQIGMTCKIAHPYATIINAESIGDNFSCIQNTTIGDKHGKRPILGNNVSLGANVIIIGDVKIGNNVTVGAGSIVVKDIPDNCIVAGNPAKIIRFKS